MQIKKELLLTIISVSCLIIPSIRLTGMHATEAPVESKINKPSQHKVIDAQNISNITPQALMQQHKNATDAKIAASKSKTNKTELKSESSHNAHEKNITLTETSATSPHQEVTASALLRTTMQNSKSLHDTYSQLTEQMNDTSTHASDATRILAQKARTLLVRAHPELVEGLVENLSLLPNRFASYLKENIIPTFSNSAGRQNFTQRFMMDTLKTMNQSYKLIRVDKNDTSSEANHFRNINQERRDSNKKDLDDFDKAISEYANKLQNVKTPEMLLSWGKTVVTELTLLAPRVVAATAVGALAGAPEIIGGTLKGAIVGAGFGGEFGYVAGKGNKNEINAAKEKIFGEMHHSSSPGERAAIVAGVQTGRIAGLVAQPARVIGAGRIVGSIAGTASGAITGGVTGGIVDGSHGILEGTQLGTQLVDSAARSLTKGANRLASSTYKALTGSSTNNATVKNNTTQPIQSNTSQTQQT